MYQTNLEWLGELVSLNMTKYGQDSYTSDSTLNLTKFDDDAGNIEVRTATHRQQSNPAPLARASQFTPILTPTLSLSLSLSQEFKPCKNEAYHTFHLWAIENKGSSTWKLQNSGWKSSQKLYLYRVDPHTG